MDHDSFGSSVSGDFCRTADALSGLQELHHQWNSGHTSLSNGIQQGCQLECAEQYDQGFAVLDSAGHIDLFSARLVDRPDRFALERIL